MEQITEKLGKAAVSRQKTAVDDAKTKRDIPSNNLEATKRT